MRILWRTAAKSTPHDVSLDALADALLTPKTARFSSWGTYAGYDRDRPYAVEGVTDLTARRVHRHGRIGEIPIEQIRSGDRCYHRLQPAEEERLGKKWMLHPDPCGENPFGESQEVPTAIRAVTPSKVRHALDDGLRRYTIPLAPPLRSADPVLAYMAAHMRRHGVLRITLDVWVDDDLVVRRLRSHYRRLRSVRTMPLSVVTMEYRDFGVPVDIDEPDAQDVMPDPKPPASCWGRHRP